MRHAAVLSAVLLVTSAALGCGDNPVDAARGRDGDGGPTGTVAAPMLATPNLAVGVTVG